MRLRFLKPAVFLAALLSAALLSSCRGLELENKTERVEEYTKSQAMIIIANERNRYQNAYSEAIWDVRTGEDTYFDKSVVKSVKALLEKVKLLCMLAEERGITATSQERDIIRQMTDTYMERLTPEDIRYIGCSRDDVQKMYTDYFTACKAAEYLIGPESTDISDSEVKVIKIMQIATEDVKKAKAILKKIKIDGADFNSMASRYSEAGQIELKLKKGTGNDLIERTAFSLDEGQVSNILFENGMYYIIKCTDGYVVNETLERKQNLKTAVDSLRFSEAIAPYEAEHKIVFFESFWKETDFQEKSGSTAENFFDIYGSYTR